MSRKIIAFAFLIFAILISVFASFKVQNICTTTTEKIEKIIEASETDIESAKVQSQEVYEYWLKNSNILKLFVGTEDTLNVKLSIYEMIFLLEQENIEGFLEEASNCKTYLYRVSDFAKPSLSKVF